MEVSSLSVLLCRRVRQWTKWTPPLRCAEVSSPTVQHSAYAYGLNTPENACSLWSVTGCQPSGKGFKMLLWRVMGAVSLGRCTSAFCRPWHKALFELSMAGIECSAYCLHASMQIFTCSDMIVIISRCLMWRLLIGCCRLGAAVLQSARYTEAALSVLQDLLTQLNSARKQKGPWSSGVGRE